MTLTVHRAVVAELMREHGDDWLAGHDPTLTELRDMAARLRTAAEDSDDPQALHDQAHALEQLAGWYDGRTP